LDERKIIEIKIGENVNEYESRLYKDNERNFMLYIEEIDFILPKLYFKDTYNLELKKIGVYSITCINYPKIYCQIFLVGKLI
jgi:hypothetical protein